MGSLDELKPKTNKSLYLVPTDKVAGKLFAGNAALKSAAMYWAMGVSKDGIAQPKGIALQTTKQINLPSGGQVQI